MSDISYASEVALFNAQAGDGSSSGVLKVPGNARTDLLVQVVVTGTDAAVTIEGSIGGLAFSPLTPEGAMSSSIAASGIYRFAKVPHSIRATTANKADTAITVVVA